MGKVGIVMGSDSDWRVMHEVGEALDEFGIEYEVGVVSAHRMPEEMIDYGKTAHERGISVIVAGAGGAAHLPGMLAAVTPLPVIGVILRFVAGGAIMRASWPPPITATTGLIVNILAGLECFFGMRSVSGQSWS